MSFNSVRPITDKDQEIPYDLWDPHYTDRRFTEAQSDGLTIFADPLVVVAPTQFGGESAEGLSYSYSDRLNTHFVGYDKMREAARVAAEEVGNHQSARFVEHMLRIALEDPELWLGHMKAGVNRGNGYSYKLYGYRSGEPTPVASTEETSASWHQLPGRPALTGEEPTGGGIIVH